MDKQMTWARFVFLCLVVVIAFCVLRGGIVRRSAELEQQETDLQVKLSRLQDRSAELQQEIRLVGTESYVENKARSDYQFMKEGEMRFAFVNPEALYQMSDAEKAIYDAEMSIE